MTRYSSYTWRTKLSSWAGTKCGRFPLEFPEWHIGWTLPVFMLPMKVFSYMNNIILLYITLSYIKLSKSTLVMSVLLLSWSSSSFWLYSLCDVSSRIVGRRACRKKTQQLRSTMKTGNSWVNAVYRKELENVLMQ